MYFKSTRNLPSIDREMELKSNAINKKMYSYLYMEETDQVAVFVGILK